MSPLEILRDQLTEQFPDLPMGLDPLGDQANWTQLLDIAYDRDTLLVVTWGSERGFGVYLDTVETAHRDPDETYQDGESAFTRIRDLIISWSSPTEVI